jgi:hypothetical protein
LAIPFNFRQRPLPYVLRSLETSRILLPIAMVSISLISLTISKFISGTFNQLLPARFKEDTERRASAAARDQHSSWGKKTT